MAQDKTLIGTTPGGKDVYFLQKGSIGRIVFGDGGELPKELKGGFTDTQNAETALKSYLARIANDKKKDK